METTWDKLNLEAWDEERQIWCHVTGVDALQNYLWLSTGYVSFTRKLDEIKLRTANLL